MNNHSKDPTTTSPHLIENQIPKLQQALNRVISLTDRLSHSEYSSKCLNISPNISTLDTKSYSIVTCTIVALMLGFHFRLKDYSFLTYRFLWVLIALPMLYLFSKKLILPRKLILFLFVRFASSSIVYAFLYSRSFLYDFHAQSLEYDILAGNLCLALASLCSSTDSQQQVKRYIGVQSLSDFILTTCLRVYYDQPFDSKVYIHQFILLAFVSVACYLVSRKADLDRQALESNVIKHCEEISEELKEIHNNLKEEESQPTPVKEPTSSVADEILTKIKYLKFKLMQEEKERRFLNTKNSVFGPNKRGMVKGFSTIALTAKMAKKIDTVTISQRRGSYKEQDRSPPAEECLTSDSVEDNGVTKWQISAKDCDSLIRMMLQKQTNLYYPDVLKETNNQINTETAEFLKQHFTEIGNNLLSNEPSKERSNPLLDESKAFAYSVWSEYLEGNACTWNFDMLKFKDLTNGRHIPEYGNFIFKKFNILKTLNTSPNIVGNFLKDVSEGYLPNPYHNSIHGADVANSTAYFLTNDEFKGYFSELEVSCLLIAALVHDLGHPGFNNAFLVATKSTEALLYNDQSVLENLHTAYYYKILQKPSSNILQNLTENNQKVFRKLSIGLILDTDLTKHFVILTKFKGMADQINMEQEENRFLSLSIALKCADVAHGAKELSLHKKWSRRINEEFYLQGDKEREHGIPVSPLCDRAGKVSNSQHGFISFIVQPLFEAFDQKFFNDKMKEEVTDQVKKNLEYWKAEIPKEEIGESKFKEETQKTLEDIQSELPKVN